MPKGTPFTAEHLILAHESVRLGDGVELHLFLEDTCDAMPIIVDVFEVTIVFKQGINGCSREKGKPHTHNQHVKQRSALCAFGGSIADGNLAREFFGVGTCDDVDDSRFECIDEVVEVLGLEVDVIVHPEEQVSVGIAGLLEEQVSSSWEIAALEGGLKDQVVFAFPPELVRESNHRNFVLRCRLVVDGHGDEKIFHRVSASVEGRAEVLTVWRATMPRAR